MSQYAVSSAQITLLTTAKAVSIHRIFARFANKPWSMLLDSADSPHPDGRFDVLVADPVCTLTTQDGQTTIEPQNGERVVVNDDPIRTLQTVIERIFGKVQQTSGQFQRVPFTFGALGYFGYDLGRSFENLPQRAEQDLSMPDMAVGLFTWSVVKDNHSGAFFVCRAHADAGPDDTQLRNWLDTAPQDTQFALTSDWSANMDKAAYKEKLAAIHAYLQAGDCYQVNLAQRFSADFDGSPYAAYQILKEANHAPFSAFIHLPHGAVLSISPERFLSVKDGKVQTKPIKGTRPRQNNPELDSQMQERLRQSEKDRAENLMIVDLLRNDLSKHCRAGSVDVPALFEIESFPAVHHLVSTVVGELENGHSPLDLLRGAFPGGSITGAPKIRAMEIIEELEPHRRNLYCGSIGYLDVHGRMDTSICIRTLICEDKRIHCWAGGGIVLDSDADAEYQECLDKVAKILPVLTKRT